MDIVVPLFQVDGGSRDVKGCIEASSKNAIVHTLAQKH